MSCALQDVEAFGIGLHQAVFDAVMDHLDEMPGAGRAGMDIALLGARIAALAARACARCRRCRAPASRRSGRAGRPRPCRRRSSCNSRARGPRRRRRCRHRHSGCPSRCSALRAADVVLVEGVAAVDDDVARLEQAGQRFDRAFGDVAGRQHHPDGARRGQCLDQVF